MERPDDKEVDTLKAEKKRDRPKWRTIDYQGSGDIKNSCIKKNNSEGLNNAAT